MQLGKISGCFSFLLKEMGPMICIFNVDETDGEGRFLFHVHLKDGFIFKRTVKWVGVCLHKFILQKLPLSESWSIHSQTNAVCNSSQRDRDLSLSVSTAVGLSQRIKYNTELYKLFHVWLYQTWAVGSPFSEHPCPRPWVFCPCPMFWPWPCSELEALEL